LFVGLADNTSIKSSLDHAALATDHARSLKIDVSAEYTPESQRDNNIAMHTGAAPMSVG
jgi:hypothetical protein